MNETQLVKKIRDGLGKIYPRSFFFKSHGGPFQMVGLPDLIGCVKGRFVAIEVKLPGKERNLKPIQKLVIRMIVRAGGIAFMSTSVEDVLDQVSKGLKEEAK